MQEIVDISKAIAEMPPATLVAIVIVSAFALAGFAIYAVLSVTKEKGRR